MPSTFNCSKRSLDSFSKMEEDWNKDCRLRTGYEGFPKGTGCQGNNGNVLKQCSQLI